MKADWNEGENFGFPTGLNIGLDLHEAFQSLEQQKEQIEEEMGESFLWHPPEEAQRERATEAKLHFVERDT